MSAILNRRQFVLAGSAAALAAVGPLRECARGADEPHAQAAGAAAPAEAAGDAVVPFLDPQVISPGKPAVNWQGLTDWITPDRDFFSVSHYGPAKLSAEGYQLSITGAVKKPLSLSLDEIRKRPSKKVTATLECSGNGASAAFMGAIGNAVWTGTPLGALLQDCGMRQRAVEVAFWGADKGKEKIRGAEYEQHFARALSIADASREDVLLAWEMNGKPLPPGHGFPLRLIVPGWYGIAWVKWLTTIEVRERRLMNRFMARDYVTIRGTPRGNSVVYTETSVGPMNVKSLVGRVVKHADGSATIHGAAWTDGTPLKSVELKIDNGPWQPAKIDAAHSAPHAWIFWSYDWKSPASGEHTLVSRATDADGHVQPARDDPSIKYKKTYWESNAQYARHVRM